VLPSTGANFDDTLWALRAADALPRPVADLLYHLKRSGNEAVHEDAGTTGQALQTLKIARGLVVWFHQTYHGPAARRFKPGPFVPPAAPAEATASLRAELDQLREVVRASVDAAVQARLAAREAETARFAAEARADEREEERRFWERYAAETEAGLRQAERALADLQSAAAAKPAGERDDLIEVALAQAGAIELDEAATRVLVDDALRAAGWTVDSGTLRHAAGARPQAGRAMAIAERPTASGPVDYALFLDGHCVGVIEAKRAAGDVPGHLGQARRYARDVRLAPDERWPGAPWRQGLQAYGVPFVFATNGRPYVKQLVTKSGIWFWDATPGGGEARALPEWFSPATSRNGSSASPTRRPVSPRRNSASRAAALPARGDPGGRARRRGGSTEYPARRGDRDRQDAACHRADVRAAAPPALPPRALPRRPQRARPADA